MTPIAVLTPAAGHDYAPVAADLIEPYRAAFADRGLKLVPQPWDEAAAGDAATIALFAWGYHQDIAAWDAVIANWPARRPLFNPPALIAWNTRKTYLTELADAGIPIVPSRFGPADDTTVAESFADFGCDELVVKPQVSAGAWLTQRLRPGEPVVPIADAILQPFLPAVGEEGELSFLFIGGRFSHAVRKVAAPGDFRIQPQFGGVLTAFTPEPDDFALATRVVAGLPAEPLYARVDLIRLPDGAWALMELEAIEPDLYVEQEPAAPARLAEALLARL